MWLVTNSGNVTLWPFCCTFQAGYQQPAGYTGYDASAYGQTAQPAATQAAGYGQAATYGQTTGKYSPSWLVLVSF